MNIIDFHTHIFPDNLAPRAIEALCANSSESKNHTDGTLNGLQQSMRKNGISKSVVLSIATKPSQVSVINSNCTGLKSSQTIPLGTIHPATENFEEEILRLKSNGIAGIKLHPEYQDFYVDDPAIFPIYEQLSACGLIVLFHAGKDPGPFSCDHALPAALKTVHKNFPQLRIVAAHLGGWKIWNQVEEHLCGLPVYFDTSAISDYISAEQFSGIISKHDSEKILFGSDSPWFDQGKTVQWIESLLSDNQKEMIFEKNALHLLTEATAG